jgi:hypothetical protein
LLLTEGVQQKKIIKENKEKKVLGENVKAVAAVKSADNNFL